MSSAELASFEFEALDAGGRRERGTVSAASPAAALAALHDRGALPLSLRSIGTHREHKRRLSTGDLALGLRVLADLLDAGMPVTRALRALEDLAPPAWRTAIPALSADVREGKSFATALERAPFAIPDVIIGIARAGEGGAGLAPAIRSAAEHMESVAATRSAIRSAVAYPIVLATGGIAAVGLLVMVVLPRLARVLGELGQQLPLSTRMVLDGAELARALAVPAALGVAIAAVAFRGLIGTAHGARAVDAALLRVPLLGTIRKAAATARAMSSLAALVESGIAIRSALVHVARAAGDAEIERRIDDARGRLATGNTIANALFEADAVTATAIRLVRAGEESGRLTSMVRHAAKLEHERAERLTKTTVRLLEPALVLTFAGIIGVVAVALLQAVYSVRPT